LAFLTQLQADNNRVVQWKLVHALLVRYHRHLMSKELKTIDILKEIALLELTAAPSFWGD
jgi:hypothetical protein